jgi:hypothetical protein
VDNSQSGCRDGRGSAHACPTTHQRWQAHAEAGGNRGNRQRQQLGAIAGAVEQWEMTADQVARRLRWLFLCRQLHHNLDASGEKLLKGAAVPSVPHPQQVPFNLIHCGFPRRKP